MSEAMILFLAANPVSSARLALDEEARDIETRIQVRSCRIPLTLRTRWAVRTEDLLLALNQDRPVVVHFSGHGAGASGLMLHGSNGQGMMVSGDALQRLFRALKDDIRIVVLNACYSEDQARPISEVIDCVIGMRRSIGDGAARTFAAAFYSALGHGRNVQNAFEQGVIAIGLEGLGEEETPKLLVRSGVTAEEVFLKVSDAASQRTSSPRRERQDLRSLDKGTSDRPVRHTCVVTLRASMHELDEEVLAELVTFLRQLTGDMTLEIKAVEEGSVRITLATTEVGLERLVESAKEGELSELVVSLDHEVKDKQQTDKPAHHVTRAEGGAQLGSRLIAGLEEPTSNRADAVGEERALRSALDRADATEGLQILTTLHRDNIYRYCRRMLGNDEEGKDVTQVVFLHAFEAIRRGATIVNARAWLHGMARNRCLDKLAGRRRGPVFLELDELKREADAQITQEDRQYVDSQTHESLRDCLDQLDPRGRVVVLLRYQDQLSYEEISKITGDAPGALRVRVARALNALRTCLERKGLSP